MAETTRDTDDSEQRCFPVTDEIRVITEDGKPSRIEGLAIPYERRSNNLGGFFEIIKTGAFSESIRSGRDITVDVEHDRRTLLGRTSKGTATVREDARGVWLSVVVPDTTLGRDTLEEVRNGTRDAMSAMWPRRTVVDKFENRNGEVIREISKAELVAVTLTAYPAYSQTAGTLTMRSLDEWRSQQEETEETQTEEFQPGTDTLRSRLDLAESEL